MSVWALLLAKLRLAAAWCKAHWQWVLPPVALLVWYFTRTKNVTVASGAVVEHDAVVADADRKAALEEAALQAGAANQVKQVKQAQADAVDALDKTSKANADSALASPEATNELLKDVSAGMRK